jgi:phenylacetate-CoA ligase
MLLEEYRAAATGGTTGERGVFVYNDRAWLSVIANIVRFQRILGVLPSTRSVGIAASSPIHMSYRFNAEQRAIRPHAPALDLTMPVPHIVETLNTYQPEAVATYPSFIRVLANEQMSGRLRIAPRFVRSGAETLTQQVRDLARAAWNAPVINSYSCTEVGFMGQECLHVSGLHLAEDLCAFEVVDEQNRPVPHGTCGAKLLVTTFTNERLPLVRYELTDVVTLTPGPCDCGLPFARIASIEGRREDVLQFPKKGGGMIDVHAIRLHSPLIGTEGIRQFQLAQLPAGLEITISVLPEFDSEVTRLRVERTVREALDKLEAAPMRIHVRVVDLIERPCREGSGSGVSVVLTGADRIETRCIPRRRDKGSPGPRQTDVRRSAVGGEALSGRLGANHRNRRDYLAAEYPSGFDVGRPEEDAGEDCSEGRADGMGDDTCACRWARRATKMPCSPIEDWCDRRGINSAATRKT